MPLEIPLIAQQAQSIKIVLDEQACEIQIRERLGLLYMSMVVDDVEVWNNYVCYDRQNVKPFSYMAFKGGLYFVDVEGNEDPRAEGLGARFFLVYLSVGEDLPAGFVNNS